MMIIERWRVMKKLLLIGACLIGVATCQEANAILILDLDSTPPLATPVKLVPPAKNPSIDEIAAALGVTTSDIGIEIYKCAPGGTESDVLASSYSTIFDPLTGGGTADIVWNGPFVANATYLLMKDGDLGSYVWNISTWDGMETIRILDCFPTKNSVSHVEFFGAVGTRVPDGGTTALLLGLATLSLGYLRRRI